VDTQLLSIALDVILLPLVGSLIAGFFGKIIGKRITHTIAIALVGISFVLAAYLFKVIVLDGQPAEEGVIYTWMKSGAYQFDVSLLLDRLSATMIFIVTFVSLAVHIYTVGYMSEDPGYQRFFCYV
jgi:NADH-quinone oxidoreductase subunit L